MNAEKEVRQDSHKIYEIVYDTVNADIRTVKIKAGRFFASIIHSPRMGSIHVTFEQPDFFGPKIEYVDKKFIMTYNYVVVPEDFQDDFKKAYDETLRFCIDMKPVIENLTEKIRKGEPI